MGDEGGVVCVYVCVRGWVGLGVGENVCVCVFGVGRECWGGRIGEYVCGGGVGG